MNRVGLGFDAHAFDDERTLVLGGLTIPGSPGLAGHSDADVVSHAIADALLGAANLGDIGGRFPPTEEWQGANSLDLLKDCAAAVRIAGWDIENIDCTVIAERPKLTIYRDRMIENLARSLDVSTDCVSLKATTTDGMGFAGRGEGIGAIAVALLNAD
jgi:2-C-methyl-D-erythritol 2,4-cyclodiphosphate synthase